MKVEEKDRQRGKERDRKKEEKKRIVNENYYESNLSRI